MRPLMLLAALAFAGCDTGPGIPPTPAQNATVSSVTRHQHALRVKLDTARSRLWVLGVDRVDVYDQSTGALIRRIALPGWSVADAVCGPDIAFDGTGTAFISHNVEARLWQIDGNSFEIKERTIRLVNHEQLDIGFGSLAFAPDGTLFGTGSMGGSLWRIDLSKARAHRVESYVRAWDACDVR
jgi:sugar lactone lactonase YvrE